MHIGRSVGSAAARVREHTTAAAQPRDAMHSRGFIIRSLRPRQRQCLRYCEAERFRGLKLTTSSNFTVCWAGKSPGFSPLTIDLAGRNTPPAETNRDAERTQKRRRKLSIERSHRFPGIQPNSGHRDYSRSSCDGGTRSSGPVPGSRQDACAGRNCRDFLPILSACRRPLHCRLWGVKSLLRHRSDRPKTQIDHRPDGLRRRPPCCFSVASWSLRTRTASYLISNGHLFTFALAFLQCR